MPGLDAITPQIWVGNYWAAYDTASLRTMGSILNLMSQSARRAGSFQETSRTVQYIGHVHFRGSSVAREDIGERGQWLFCTLLTELCGRNEPFFCPRFLGDKYPTFDYIVEVVDNPAYFLLR